MSEERPGMDAEIPALKVATDALRLDLVAFDLALTKHPNDTYLQGQAREHVWKSYWELREAAGDAPTGADQKLKEQEERCERLEEALRRLQMGPDTLTQAGLRIVLDARYPEARTALQSHEQEEREK